MENAKLLISSHAPFWHNGSSVTARSYHIMLATLPALLYGLFQYGMPALGVVSLSIGCAVLWELLMNIVMRRPISIGDGNAVLIGLLFAMLLPATAPWWIVLIGTFLAVVIGKHIFGGIGCNPFSPPLVAIAMITLSWKFVLDFNAALVNYDLGFYMAYPLGEVKRLGPFVLTRYSIPGFLMGQQTGGLGATFGLGLIIGGIYLIVRRHIRWEISLSFLAGVLVTAFLFHVSDPTAYAGPIFHLLTGYTLIGAFFLATEDSSSPVNVVPMLIYGACGGVLTVLIRNIGAFPDGVVFAILLMNVASPLIDKIRPKALGRGLEHA
jgi:electron transport complex protein RnfD